MMSLWCLGIHDEANDDVEDRLALVQGPSTTLIETILSTSESN